MAAVYKSSAHRQLAAIQQQMTEYVDRAVRDFGRRFRARMNRERLSGPPGVDRVTGRLKRSLRYKVKKSPGAVSMDAQIGGAAAPHAEELEDNNLLQFGRVFEEEAARAVDGIRVGLQFIARRPA